MSEAGFVRLTGRGVLAVGGPEAEPFLQGLLSCDVAAITPERCGYGALLTPQGKFLFDFVIYRWADGFLLDGEGERLADLMRRLTMYRLRSKVTLEDLTENLAVVAVLTPALAELVGEARGACRTIDGGLLAVDPRLRELGGRAVLPRGSLDATMAELGLAELPYATWERRRLALGVPDGSRDMQVERAILLEAGFEELNGVSFTKGCFVGQELTARTKHRALIRKRLMPVELDGPPVAPGTPITLGGKDAGEMRSSDGPKGLALLRLESVAAASDGSALMAGETAVRPRRPDWAHF